MCAFAERVRAGDVGGTRPARASAPSSTSGSAGATSARRWPTRRCGARRRPRSRSAFVVERRPRRPRRGDARPRPARDALRRRLEDDVDARDRSRTRGRRGSGSRPAVGREDGLERHFVGVAVKAEAGRGDRDPAREHVPLLGLGRGADVAVLGGRALDVGRARAPSGFRELLDGFHAMDEHFAHGAARGEPAGDRGSARRLVPRLPRSADDGGRSPTRTRCGCFPPICSS